MPFVVDASMAASWFLPDEANPATADLGRRAAREPPLTPSLFLHEMRNIFVMAARRGRGSEADMLRQLAIVEKLYAKPVGAGDGAAVARLAFKHRLTAYDATYLALALEAKTSLATLDEDLAVAAKAEAVAVLGPLGP